MAQGLTYSAARGIFPDQGSKWCPLHRQAGGFSSTELPETSLASSFEGGAVICAAATAAKSLQSCPTLCDPIDGSPRGSPVPGILQARTLEWVAISFSNA